MANNASALHGPGLTQTLWLEAMEAQLQGLKLLNTIIKTFSDHDEQFKFKGGISYSHKVLLQQWHVDQLIMTGATPFAWGADPLTAVMAASQSVPGDSLINAWNLETNAAWWYFEKPLPVQTVSNETLQVKALSFGWITADQWTGPNSRGRRKGGPGFIVTCWIPDPFAGHNDITELSEMIDRSGMPVTAAIQGPSGRLMPSQVWTWFEGDTLDQMLTRVKEEHIAIYGPNARLGKTPQVGLDVFMHATETISRLILAGFVWMNQRVLTVTDGQVPRQRRKDFHKHTAEDRLIKIVQLRKTEQTHTEKPRTAEQQRMLDTLGRETYYTVRFEVDGHWRNQACGPNFTDRRLTWINAFEKGPKGLPLSTPKYKVYQVTR